VRGHLRAEYRSGGESLKLTIVSERGDEAGSWRRCRRCRARAQSGRTREEARENVIDALRGILELRFGERARATPAPDSESLELTIAA